MGDRRFRPFLDAVLGAEDRAKAIYDLPDEGAIQALAAMVLARPDEQDPLLANILATEALNRLERARLIAQHLADGAFALDVEGRVTFLNPAAERMTGFAAAELCGHELHETLAARDAAGRPQPREAVGALRALREGVEAHAGAEEAFARKDGTRFPVEYAAAPVLREGRPAGAVVVFRDRTRKRRAEERLRAVLEGLPVGVVLLDAEGRVRMTNQAVVRMMGEAAPRVDATPDRSRFRYADGGDEEWASVRALRGEAVLDRELIVQAGEEARTLLQSAVPLRDAQGRVDGAVVTFVDITDRKAGEVESLRRRDLYETLVRAQSDLGEGVVLSRAGRILFANDAIGGIAGYAPEELLAMPSFLPLIAPEEREEMAMRVRRRMMGEASQDRYETVILRKDGTRAAVEMSVKTLASGDGPPTVIALVRDLSDVKRAFAEAREVEARYRLLVESVHEYAIFMLDVDGRIVSWNPGAERIKGYRAEEVLGKHFGIFYVPEERERGLPEATLRGALETGQCAQEGWRVRKDGTRFLASVVITPLRDASGELRGFAKVTRDLSERVAHEALERRASEQAGRNRELEAFSYTVAHDLRAPLRGMLHLAEFMERDYEGEMDEDGMQNLRAIRSSAERMSRLVEDLLQLSRSTNVDLHLEDVDVTRAARQALAALAERDPARGVEARVEEGMRARADAGLVRIVLDNLLGNAWKFTRKTPQARIEVGRADTPHGPAFFVRDNGAGFDARKAHELFAPFRRLHHPNEFEGTGVGLATVRRIVERHGGRAWAEGEVGKGATVWFTFDPVAGVGRR